MTFIATVKAKDGVAIIADSLVTTARPIIEWGDFEKYLEEKVDANGEDTVTFTADEIGGLFDYKPSHTQDFENKLFQLDPYTAVTTAGSAEIDGSRIESVVADFPKSKGYGKKKVDGKVKEFCDYLVLRVRAHLSKESSFGGTSFILTHFDKKALATTIYEIRAKKAEAARLNDPGFEFVTYEKAFDEKVVVCEGQNRISERILLGEFYDFGSWLPIISGVVEKLIEDFEIKDIPDGYLESLLSPTEIIKKLEVADANLFKLKKLSLQQAVNLASLLMKLEIEFQQYTKDIPTVGGVVKLAVIDRDGFRILDGNQLRVPTH